MSSLWFNTSVPPPIEDGIYTISLRNKLGIEVLHEDDNDIFFFTKTAKIKKLISNIGNADNMCTLCMDNERVILRETEFHGNITKKTDLSDNTAVVELFKDFLLEYPEELREKGLVLQDKAVLQIYLRNGYPNFVLGGSFIDIKEVEKTRSIKPKSSSMSNETTFTTPLISQQNPQQKPTLLKGIINGVSAWWNKS